MSDQTFQRVSGQDPVPPVLNVGPELSQITPGQKPPDGLVGQPYQGYMLTAFQLHPSPLNTTITGWSCLDAKKMPPGLSLDKQSGTISGTPTQAGTFTFKVQCNDSYGPSMYSEPTDVTLTID